MKRLVQEDTHFMTNIGNEKPYSMWRKMLKIIIEDIGLYKQGVQLAGEYSDMQHSGVKLSLVRIPRVIKEICTLNVLVMEHYEGIRLSDAIDMEKQHLAKALGMQDGEELKTVMARKMRTQRW
jgi:hypothetical protein